MGRMKEVYIQMIEEGFLGEPNDYLKQVVAEYATPIAERSDTLCPNCLASNLNKKDDQLDCVNCGQEFILVENSLRFK